MTLDEQILKEAKEVRDKLLDLQHDVDRARVDYQHVIRRLHAAGGSLREIADELGLSHQRVHQIVDGGPEEIRRREPRDVVRRRRLAGPFARFTRLARQAVAKAEAESHDLGHAYLGTEHLLLALFGVERGGAAAALADLGLTYERVRDAVVEAIGQPPPGRAGGPIPLTRLAKKALDLALRESLRLGYRRVGTEHLLLGLAAAGNGLAADVLEQLGADEQSVRAAVEKVLGR